MMGAIVRCHVFESLIGFEQMYCTRKGQLLFPRLLLFILVLVEYKLQLCLCLHREPFKDIILLISNMPVKEKKIITRLIKISVFITFMRFGSFFETAKKVALESRLKFK